MAREEAERAATQAERAMEEANRAAEEAQRAAGEAKRVAEEAKRAAEEARRVAEQIKQERVENARIERQTEHLPIPALPATVKLEAYSHPVVSKKSASAAPEDAQVKQEFKWSKVNVKDENK
jgi:membrane protein involved in colicin uptake